MGTSSYLPSFDDDATADFLASINEKTSKIVNEEIRKLDKDLMKAKDESLFWNKWMIANSIITSLKHNAYIDVDLFKKAVKYYYDCLNDKNLEQYCKRSSSTFKSQINKVLKVISDIKPIKDKRRNVYYAPYLKF